MRSFILNSPINSGYSILSERTVIRAVCCLFFLSVLFPAQAQEKGRIADSVATFLIPENLEPFLGLGMVMIEKDKEDFRFTHGFQNSEEEQDFTDSTLFNLGSVSKLFTAISIVKLAEAGGLKLDDPVYYYFPEFLDIQGGEKYAHEVTILDLLQHRSGISQSMVHLYPEKFDKEAFESEQAFYNNTFNYRAFMSTEDFRNRFLMYARMERKPWKKYIFSNLGFVVLGYIVEEVSGMNMAQFVTNQIFTPLGMNDSHYYMTPDDQSDRLARGYYKLTDGSYLNVHENEVESPSPTGDGGIKTSLRDMAKFMKFLIGDSRNKTYDKVLARSSLVTMMAPHRKGPDKDTWVGVGFHNLQPYNFSGHAGGWDGFLNILYYHPESHSCLFLTSNREDNELFLFLRVYAAYAMLRGDF